MKIISQRHGISSTSLELFPSGSVFVFALGEKYVLKLFPPLSPEFCQTEHAVLSILQSHRADLKTPRIHFTGDFEGWPYIVMSKLPGLPLQNIWPELSQAQRRDVVEQTAELVRILHQVPTAHAHLPQSEFIEAQRGNCLNHHQHFELDPHWLKQIPEFLESVTLHSSFDTPPVLLHTEIMRQHLLVDVTASQPKITGLIDFEPSMIGHFEYELASITLFVTGSDTHLFPIFLKNYKAELLKDAELKRRILAYILLHRYSYLNWFLTLMPPVNNFQDCLDRWFS
ncbi:phosphotransferase family protein [candidate division CSSED10-310 bacterium]|uniref:Phosphotransferase family protein n=1 Tax=candidate division CSSED10-310 bacterium TaxID=2855610 RepID=A0ABV6Z6M3_UNCC1